MNTVRIPTVLRSAAGGNATVSVSGTTIREVLGELNARFPTMHDQLFNADGTLHRFLNIYVNDDDVRYIGGLDAVVGSDVEITLLPAVAGGCVE